MSAQGKPATNVEKVEALLRSPDGTAWHDAPAHLHDRIMAALDLPQTVLEQPAPRNAWRLTSIAAAIALVAGATGLIVGASIWRPAAGTALANSESLRVAENTSVQPAAETPTVVVSRIFEEFKPATSSQLVASVSAPMRSEAQGLVTETQFAARTVLSRLPFVSME
jgi:hypothetical protein